MNDTVSLALLAGGRSLRLGEDKAFASFSDGTVIEWMRDRFSGVFPNTFLVIRDPARYQHLGIPVVNDALTEEGSTVGLYTAVLASPTDRVICLAGRHALRHAAVPARAGREVQGLRRLRAAARRVHAAALRRLQQGGAEPLSRVHPLGQAAHLRHLSRLQHRLSGDGRGRLRGSRRALHEHQHACRAGGRPRSGSRRRKGAGARRSSPASRPSWTRARYR